ncbi:hypothetical protein KP509_02G026300 [Ceratopteris richardii]|uniref:Uncharacterized protein n=1 Tax=Ceratopteris richardii TaxID=49495 RepID=A0A8T2V759_CERRI|nr:hypothetical protein KP509_02G026300 [Ceratopteris richardii]
MRGVEQLKTRASIIYLRQGSATPDLRCCFFWEDALILGGVLSDALDITLESPSFFSLLVRFMRCIQSVRKMNQNVINLIISSLNFPSICRKISLEKRKHSVGDWDSGVCVSLLHSIVRLCAHLSASAMEWTLYGEYRGGRRIPQGF